MPASIEMPIVELFFGHVSMAEARVYARWQANTEIKALKGTIRGPRCVYSKTLLATVPFRDKGAGPTRLIEAVVPDPCVWTPELPFLYDVSIEWTDAQQQKQTVQQTVGLPAFGLREGGFRWENRPWTLRAQRVAAVNPNDFSLWRDADVALAVPWPDEATCKAASEAGTMLVALCQGSVPHPLAELQRLCRWPAVVMAVLPASSIWPADLAKLVPNLLLAEYQTSGQTLSPWATLGVWESTTPPENQTAPFIWSVTNPIGEPFPHLAQFAAKQNEAKNTPVGYII